MSQAFNSYTAKERCGACHGSGEGGAYGHCTVCNGTGTIVVTQDMATRVLDAIERGEPVELFTAEEKATLRAALRAYKSSRLQPEKSPEGWKLVPIEPTVEMWDRAENASMYFRELSDNELRARGFFDFPTQRIAHIVHCYRTMVEAAPQVPDSCASDGTGSRPSLSACDADERSRSPATKPAEAALDRVERRKDNWTLLVNEYWPKYNFKYIDHRGREMTFFGLVHAEDDLYYGLMDKDGKLTLASCVGSLDGEHGWGKQVPNGGRCSLCNDVYPVSGPVKCDRYRCPKGDYPLDATSNTERKS